MNRDTSNLTKYIEAANIDYKLIKKAESAELKESISKCNIRIRESVGSVADGWWVPISFYEKKNANERIYGKKLWENVINNQRDIWVGAPMLVDHPSGDSDGSPKDICGVWLDAKMDPPDRMGEGLVYGLLIPSGHNGDDLKDHLNHGLKVGTSSSGFGKLLQDGHTVDPDTFVIERLSDWVLNPSQGTFFSYEEDAKGEKEITNKSKPINESVEHINVVKEKFVKDSKIAKLEEKKFRRDMESFLEDASNIKDPQERLLEFKEIESYLEDGACPDLKEKIEEKIAAEEEYIRTAIREKAELREELQIESPKDLKEKLTKIVEDSAIINKEAKDWKRISENLQDELLAVKAKLDDRPTQAYADYLKERNENLSNSLKEGKIKAKKVVEDTATAYKEAATNNGKLVSKIKSLIEEKEDLNKKLTEAEDLIKRAAEAMRVYRESTDSLNKEISLKESTLSDTVKELENTKKLLEAEKENSVKLTEKLERKTRTAKELSAQNIKMAEAEAARLKKEHNNILIANMSEAELYFEKLQKTYGDEILEYKEEITSAKTLAEAKRIFYEEVLQNLQETKNIEEMRIPESLNVSPKDRKNALGEKNFKKATSVERLPKGWY